MSDNSWIDKLGRQDLPVGVYLGLSEESYLRDVGLGSSDMKRLAYSPEDFWFESKMNPMWEQDESTPAQKLGTAMHKMVLEGRQSFEGRYAPTDFPGNVKAGINERRRIEEDGKLAMSRRDWDRLQIQGAVIRANPVLAEAFDGGVGSEVTILWQANGMKKKCRIDKLKLRASVDLKSISNSRSISFPEACRRAIHEYGYHVQAEHYREGRMQLSRLVGAGKVYDADGKSVGHGGPLIVNLGKIAAQRAFAWVLVFCQATGAPLTWGTVMSFSPDQKNPLLEIAAMTIRRAEDNYRTYMEKFGPESPWVLAEPLLELALEDFPPWAFQG